METLNRFTNLHLVNRNGEIIVRADERQFSQRYGKIRQSGQQVEFFPDNHTRLRAEQMKEIALLMEIIRARFWDYVNSTMNLPNAE